MIPTESHSFYDFLSYHPCSDVPDDPNEGACALVVVRAAVLVVEITTEALNHVRIELAKRALLINPASRHGLTGKMR